VSSFPLDGIYDTKRSFEIVYEAGHFNDILSVL